MLLLGLGLWVPGAQLQAIRPGMRVVRLGWQVPGARLQEIRLGLGVAWCGWWGNRLGLKLGQSGE